MDSIRAWIWRGIALVCVIGICSRLAFASLDERYGRDFIDMKYEREIEWVREHKRVVYDVADHRLKRVRYLSDEELRAILEHPGSRRRLGIASANISYNFTSDTSKDVFTTCLYQRAFARYPVHRGFNIPFDQLFIDLWCRSVTT